MRTIAAVGRFGRATVACSDGVAAAQLDVLLTATRVRGVR